MLFTVCIIFECNFTKYEYYTIRLGQNQYLKLLQDLNLKDLVYCAIRLE